MEVSNTYHDTKVIVDGVEYEISKSSFGTQLICERTAGWTLWFHETEIGNEFSSAEFKIKIGETIVFDNTLEHS